MNLSLRILESDAEISDMILNSIRTYLQPRFVRAVNNISSKLPAIVGNAIRSQPEYTSLVNGVLKFELGVPDADSRISNILDIWSRSLSVDYGQIRSSGRGLSASFSVNMIPEDYSDILSSDYAIVIDSVSGITIPWLEWLLLEGGKILVKNYTVKFGPNSRSRTGFAIMVSSNENWRVPPEFAGTKNNNWITRALEPIENTVIDLMIQELESVI